jgi:hypothetical protein
MHIKDGPQTMARVGLEIASITVLGGLVQVVILADELLELRLHVHDLLGGKFEFDYGDAGCFEVCKETDFGGLEEHEGTATAIGASRSASDAVDIFAGVVRSFELNNPVYIRDLWSQYMISMGVNEDLSLHLSLLLPRPYISECLVLRYRTRRRCWFVFAAFACREDQVLAGRYN